ncbi:formyltransferase family protein [Halomonas alkaliantarctica]|uniref:phosphoribosylglycinamide formyltransferase 1 n=1 Tax=Halomonas alkaliantarctica TaxID=232346 RepID=A0ABY8LPG2_9GAMM|nr:formyltransferase family protein [Halomonas alkaliantarctica]WGI26276.1 formyltransferase family protein [Halomonas alkaliantarctica]
MSKLKLAYILSLRNAAADKAGQYIEYKGEKQYMMSPLEYLVTSLNETPLGDAYSLETVIYDDDEGSIKDQEKLKDYGFCRQLGKPWILPQELFVKGCHIDDLFCSIPSTYRRLPTDSPDRLPAKSTFEKSLLEKLVAVGADVVVLDGLLVILDELIRPQSPFYRKIVNIHPGLTRQDSPYQRRGASATFDALYAAQGKKVINWQTMETESVPAINKTGASLHYVDSGIDSGEVIYDLLETHIDPDDSIIELRWRNFNKSLFPALHEGLEALKNDIKASSTC